MSPAKINNAFNGAVALICLAGIYGFIGYFARELAPGLSLWQQLYIRLVLAIPFLWITFLKKINARNCVELLKTEPFLVGLRSICLFVVSVPLYFYATQHAKLGNVAFLQVLPYIFVLGAVINKEKLTKQKIVLMLLAMIGAYMIAVKSGLDFTHIGKGELASIISGVMFSLGFVTRKKHRSKANDYEISLTLMTISILAVIILSILTGDQLPHPADVDIRFFILLIVASYLNVAIILLSNYGFRHVRDTFANNIMALEGTFGLLFGYLIYREIPVLREVLGASIILVSAIASAFFVKQKTQN